MQDYKNNGEVDCENRNREHDWKIKVSKKKLKKSQRE